MREPHTAPDRSTCEIRNWVVFGPGWHKGRFYYSPADIRRMAANFARLSTGSAPHVEVTAKIGHDPEQRFARSLGFPALGRVILAGLSPKGMFIIRRLAQVPVDVGAAVNAGLLRSGSVELIDDLPDPRDASTNIPGPILTGVALLGEEPPALKGLTRPVAVYPDGTPVPPSTNLGPWVRAMAQVAAAVPHQPTFATRDGRTYASHTIAFSEMFTPGRDAKKRERKSTSASQRSRRPNRVPSSVLRVPSEDLSVHDQIVQQLQALGVDATQPPFAGLSDDALEQILTALQGGADPAEMSDDQESFSDDSADPAEQMMSAWKTYADDPATPAFAQTMMAAFADCVGGLTKRVGALEAAESGRQKTAAASFGDRVAAAVDSAILRGAITRRQRDTYLTAGLAKDRVRVFGAGPERGKTAAQAWLDDLNALPPGPMFREEIGAPEAGDPLADPFVLRAARHIPKLRETVSGKK